MFHKLPLIFVAVPLLGGCASHIGAFFNRPVVQDEVPGAIATFAQSSDRRTVIVSTREASAGKFCAEPPPDSATGLKTDLTASLEARQGKFQLGDKMATSISVLADRTANLDAFRTGVYALCQFNLNGALSGEDVKQMFLHLSDNFAAVEKLAVSTDRAIPVALAGSAPR